MHAAIWGRVLHDGYQDAGGGRGDETHNAAIVARATGTHKAHPRPAGPAWGPALPVRPGAPAAQGSVTAPRSAPVTSRAYLARTPVR